MSDLPAIILLRQSPNWEKLDYSYLNKTRDFEDLVNLPRGFVERLIRLWDMTFEITYFQVRKK